MSRKFGDRVEFTALQIREIRKKYLSGKTQLQLATEYKVSQKTIAFIIKRYSYVNIGVPDNYEERLKARMGKYYDKRFRGKEIK